MVHSQLFSSFARKFAVVLLICALGGYLFAQQTVPPSLVNDVIQKQLDATAQANFAYKYTLHKTDKHGNVVRVEIATPYGYVARTVLREGKPLDAKATAYEMDQLRNIIQSASEQKKKTKAAAESRKDTEEVVNALRTAMIYTLRSGQPQLPSFPSPQIVIDFKPNPAFHPGSMTQEALQGMEGTVWIDAKTHLLRRIEARSVKDFNVLLGIAVKVYAGATMEAEQREYSPGKLATSRLKVEAKLREFLFKTVNFRTDQTMTDMQRLPDGLTLAAAAKMLLDMPVPH